MVRHGGTSQLKPVGGSKGPPAWNLWVNPGKDVNKTGCESKLIFSWVLLIDRNLSIRSVCYAHALQKKKPYSNTTRLENSCWWCQFVTDGMTGWHCSHQHRGDAKDSWGLPWSPLPCLDFCLWLDTSGPLRHCWKYKLSACPSYHWKLNVFLPKKLQSKHRKQILLITRQCLYLTGSLAVIY